ncbi:MAG: hypothetical protein NTX05_01605 [Fusobacteria bacterium]|nr:hypothetical protein [Fusobacteriota bacterium]
MKKIVFGVTVLSLLVLFMGCSSVNTITSTTTALTQVPSTVLTGPMKQVSGKNPITFDMKMTITSGSATVWVTNPASEIVFPKTTYTSGTSTVSMAFKPVSEGGIWSYNVVTTENASGDMAISLKQNN